MSFVNYSLTIEKRDSFGFWNHVVEIDLPGVLEEEEAIEKAKELQACLKNGCGVSINMIKRECVGHITE